jgi:hypothetical protein
VTRWSWEEQEDDERETDMSAETLETALETAASAWADTPTTKETPMSATRVAEGVSKRIVVVCV